MRGVALTACTLSWVLATGCASELRELRPVQGPMWGAPHPLVQLEGPAANEDKEESCTKAVVRAGHELTTTAPVQAVLTLADEGNQLTILTPGGVVLAEERPRWSTDQLCTDAVAQIDRFPPPSQLPVPVAAGQAGQAGMSGQALPPNPAQMEYAQRYIGVAEIADGASVDAWPDPYLGVQRKRLSRVDFFRLVGRPELGAQATSRRKLKTGLMLGGLIGGGAALLAGVYTGIYAPCSLLNSNRSCGDSVASGAAISLIAVGAAVMIALPTASAVMKQEEVSGPEVRAMAEAYNRGLRQHLGLPESPQSRAPLSRPRAPSLSLSLAPQLAPTGGGVALIGRF